MDVAESGYSSMSSAVTAGFHSAVTAAVDRVGVPVAHAKRGAIDAPPRSRTTNLQ
jgi:hypothetical protein